MPLPFIPPTPEQAEPVRALADHLGYGQVLAPEGSGAVLVFALNSHECRQLLYELTDDKRWLNA